ncbi:MAG: tRNA dihydrouridine synthase [Spirochaetota bacterium]
MSEERDRVLAILRGGARPADRPGSPGARAEAAPRRSSAGPPLLLAPMATITHAGFRTLVDEFGGSDLLWSEMISAEALVNGTPYESYYLNEAPDPDRLIFQLVGYREGPIVLATERLAQTAAAGLDLNLGCSAPHIVRKGGGIAWTRDVDRTARLVERMRRAAVGKSLSVKLRLGASDDPDELVRLARALEEAGADFLTLHPKRQKEGPARRARWSYVRLLRDELAIPVVGSGGLTGYDALEARLREGGDGPVMIGRAAVRAPWIFAYLRERLSGNATELRVDLRSTGERFLELLERFQPGDFHHSRARRVLPYLLSNVKFGHAISARVAQSDSYETARRLFTGYLDEHPDAALHVERG